MNNALSNISTAQLLRAAKLKEKITKLTKELDSILGDSSIRSMGKRKHKMSAAGRARIAAAQRARWAKIKSVKKA
jgi:hypothetical protein